MSGALHLGEVSYSAAVLLYAVLVGGVPLVALALLAFERLWRRRHPPGPTP